MAQVSDEDDFVALLLITRCFVVYFAHQRTGCIDYLQPANTGIVRDLSGYAMGTEHGDGARRDVSDFFNETSALVPQAIYNVFVVDDFVPNVDGCAIVLQRAFDDVYGSDDTGTKPSRPRPNDAQGWLRHLTLPELLRLCVWPMAHHCTAATPESRGRHLHFAPDEGRHLIGRCRWRDESLPGLGRLPPLFPSARVGYKA